MYIYCVCVNIKREDATVFEEDFFKGHFAMNRSNRPYLWSMHNLAPIQSCFIEEKYE